MVNLQQSRTHKQKEREKEFDLYADVGGEREIMLILACVNLLGVGKFEHVQTRCELFLSLSRVRSVPWSSFE